MMTDDIDVKINLSSDSTSKKRPNRKLVGTEEITFDPKECALETKSTKLGIQLILPDEYLITGLRLRVTSVDAFKSRF
jgi:hypothetical protein